jgi:hypothetical protein
MATLLNAVTTTSTGAAQEVVGPISVQVFGTFAGAEVEIEISMDGTNFVTVGRDGVFKQPGCVHINAPGTIDLRGVVRNVTSDTSVSAITP